MQSAEGFSFFLRCVPPNKTAQGKGVRVVNGRPHFFTKKDHAQDERDYQVLMAQHQIPAPITGPVWLHISATWPYLKSHVSTKKNAAREDLIWHTGKPDLDNFVKALIDQLVKMRFLEDDKQIAMMTIRKMYGPPDAVGIEIKCEVLGNG